MGADIWPDGATAPVPEPPRPSRPRWATDVINDPAPVEIIEGVSWGGLLTVLVAESGAGKTFVLLDAAAAVSAGVAWHGRTTRQGTVAYCSFEGDAMGLRFRALQEHQHRTVHHLALLQLSEPLSPIVTREGELRSPGEAILAGELKALQDTIALERRPPLGLIVIDTIRASMTGSEDSSEHVSAYLRAARRLLALAPGAGCILAHHAGWQDGESKRKRERGSSAFRGNVDGTLYLESGVYDRDRGEAELTLRTVKARDAETLAPLHLIRRRVEFAEALDPTDLRRGPRTSCVIERDARTREDIAAAQAAAVDAGQQETDRRILQVIRDRRITSIAGLQSQLLMRREEAHQGLARVLTAGWAAAPERQRYPYTVTPAGSAALNGGADHE